MAEFLKGVTAKLSETGTAGLSDVENRLKLGTGVVTAKAAAVGEKIEEAKKKASAKLGAVGAVFKKEEEAPVTTPGNGGGRRKSKRRRSKKRTGRKSKRRTGRKGKKRVRFSKRR